MDRRICSIKLLSGQELIAEFLWMNNGIVAVKNPLVVHVMKGQNGEGHIGFSVWSLIVQEDQTVQIPETAIAARPMDVLPEIERSYLEQVTGLALPPTTGAILKG